MDFFITAFIYWIFNIFNPKKKVTKGMTKHKPPVQKRNDWGVFFFTDTQQGVNQKDDDPFLNSDYDDGPDW